jgi:predicted alpha/beta-hydrolase family hydrolase
MTAESLSIEIGDGQRVSGRLYSAAERAPLLVLAHGAGAGQQSAFMIGFASALAALGVHALTFNFRYIELKRRAPDPPAVLEGCYRSVVAHALDAGLGDDGLFIGGKSMGGRIATQIAAADRAMPLGGLVLLGYPLHPPGRPQQMRDKHLPDVRRPALFVQGSRDTFGTPGELGPVLARMTPHADLHVVEGGDHSFTVTRNAERQKTVIDEVRRVVADWVLTRRAAR